MVILFKGTDKSQNLAPQALALCAGLSSTKYLKKTLVMQLTTKYPIENYLIGKKIHDQNIVQQQYTFEDTGMDSLTRRAGITSFNKSHFANAVIPAVSSENLLDILEISKKNENDVEREIINNPTTIGTIIKSAKKIYDNIFVLVDGKSAELIEKIIPYIDKSVTCVMQGKKEETTAPSSEDNYYLVTDYDYKSVYSASQMVTIYESKKLFTMPYNVDFKDAYTDENMLQYILHNINPEKSDYSYHLITEMSQMVYILTENEDVEKDEYKFTRRTFQRSIAKPIRLEEENVDVEITEKKFLKKSKTLVHVSEQPIEHKSPEPKPKKKKFAIFKSRKEKKKKDANN